MVVFFLLLIHLFMFLLLVFFMLASRFGVDRALSLPLAGAGEGWSGPPRLIDVRPSGLRLNGFEVELGALPDALDRLSDGPEDVVVLCGRDGATVQRLADVVRAARRDATLSIGGRSKDG